MKRLMVRLAAVSVLALGVTSVPVAAEALPGSCHGGSYKLSTQWTAWTQCGTSATGSYFRTVARCYHVTPTGSRDYYYKYGPWVWQNSTPDPLINGGASTAHCASGDGLYSYDAGLS